MNKLCVYLSHPHFNEPAGNCVSSFNEFYEKRPWYCDLGDDPSFYCADKYNSNVTWGVCRHNVREVIDIGDEIHFVACDKSGYAVKDNGLWDYYYVGYGVVGDKISQKDIYTNRNYSHFQQYFNMLIKPHRNGYIHWEAFDESWWHDDWMMRISNARQNSEIEEFLDGDVKAGCGNNGKREKNPEVILSNFPFGKNYIIFDKKKSKFHFKKKMLIQQVKWYGFRKCKPVFTHKLLKDVFGDKFCLTNGSYQHPALNLDKSKCEKL